MRALEAADAGAPVPRSLKGSDLAQSSTSSVGFGRWRLPGQRIMQQERTEYEQIEYVSELVTVYRFSEFV